MDIIKALLKTAVHFKKLFNFVNVWSNLMKLVCTIITPSIWTPDIFKHP